MGSPGKGMRGDTGVDSSWEYKKGLITVTGVYAVGRVLCSAVGVVESERHAWATKLMQTVHSVVSSGVGLHCSTEIYSAPKEQYLPYPLLTKQIWWELAYYTVDLLADTINSLKRKDFSLTLLGFQAHHLVPILASFTVSEWRASRVTKSTDWVLATLFTANISSVFQHFMWVLDRSGAKRTGLLYKSNLVAFILSFVLIRFYGLAVLLRKFSQMDDGGPPTIRRAIQKMPIVCRVSTTFLTLLNLIWCFMNVNNKIRPLLLKKP